MRRTIWVLIVLAILGGLGFLGDRYAAHVAAGRIATAVQTDAKLAHKPHVVIQGFPFLTQVADGKLQAHRRDGDRHLPARRAGRIGAEARLRRRADPAVEGAARGRRHGAGAEVTGTAAVPFSDLLAVADIPGLTIISATPGGNQLKVSEVVATGPTSVTALVTAGVAVRGGSLVLSALNVTQANGKPVPAAVRQQVLAQAVFSVKLPGLPTGVQMTAVSVTASGLTGHAARQLTGAHPLRARFGARRMSSPAALLCRDMCGRAALPRMCGRAKRAKEGPAGAAGGGGRSADRRSSARARTRVGDQRPSGRSDRGRRVARASATWLTVGRIAAPNS